MRPPGGQLAHLRVGRKTSSNIIDGFIEFDATAPEDNPEIYEFEVLLAGGSAMGFKHGSHLDFNQGNFNGYQLDNPGEHYRICSRPLNPDAHTSNLMLMMAPPSRPIRLARKARLTKSLRFLAIQASPTSSPVRDAGATNRFPIPIHSLRKKKISYETDRSNFLGSDFH